MKIVETRCKIFFNIFAIFGLLISHWCLNETFVDYSILILRNDVQGSNSYFFNRPWSQYQQEFGSLTSQYWIGLDALHEVSQTNCRIRFDLQLLNGSWYYAEYTSFSVDDASTSYTLTIGGYSGNLWDAMAYHNGMQFSTYDFDNDQDLTVQLCCSSRRRILVQCLRLRLPDVISSKPGLLLAYDSDLLAIFEFRWNAFDVLTGGNTEHDVLNSESLNDI